ncbi:MAG: hypothetical protein ABSE59_07400 [Opitutaceae bacterium]|jgi:antitoxin (DNA-binding transcriptional repressor) of toxin-antitoxin stability system
MKSYEVHRVPLLVRWRKFFGSGENAANPMQRHGAAFRSMPSLGLDSLLAPASLDGDSNESHIGLVKTFKISEAKKNMGRVFARAKRGEVVLLRHGQDLMQLVPYESPEPIPQRPVGYFPVSEEESALINAQPDDEPPSP